MIFIKHQNFLVQLAINCLGEIEHSRNMLAQMAPADLYTETSLLRPHHREG